MAVPVVYGPAYSTYTRTARLALEEKGVPYDLVEVSMIEGAHHTPEFLSRNPFGTLPLLDDAGFALYETAAVTRYVDRAFPGPPLQPAAPRTCARMDQIISIIDSQLYHAAVRTLVAQRLIRPMTGARSDEEMIAGALPHIRLCLSELEKLLAGQAFLAGTAISLADLHLAPIFAYFIMTPESTPILAPLPGLRRWWAQISGRESMRSTQPSFG